MTLGYANPSFAAPKKCDGAPVGTPGCGTGEDPATTFSVEMKPGTVADEEGLVLSNGACGTTEGENRGASFPKECVTVEDVFFITGPTGGPLTLRAFLLEVRVNKLDMLIFFTDVPIESSSPVPNDSVYVSDRLPVTISGNGSITVKVNMSGLALIKAHQPRKRDLVGPIAIGTIVFTPI